MVQDIQDLTKLAAIPMELLLILWHKQVVDCVNKGTICSSKRAIKRRAPSEPTGELTLLRRPQLDLKVGATVNYHPWCASWSQSVSAW